MKTKVFLIYKKYHSLFVSWTKDEEYAKSHDSEKYQFFEFDVESEEPFEKLYLIERKGESAVLEPTPNFEKVEDIAAEYHYSRIGGDWNVAMTTFDLNDYLIYEEYED
jgi:hypothetical protein